MNNIAQESLKTLFTTLAANQQPIRIIIGARETNQSGWVATDIDSPNLLEPQDWARYFAPASDRKLLDSYCLLEEVLMIAGFKVELLEYFDETGKFHDQEWDQDQGLIKRSKRFAPRNNLSFNHDLDHQIPATFAQEYSAQRLAECCSSPRNTYYTSIVVDAWKLS